MRDYLKKSVREALSSVEGVPPDFEPDLEQPGNPDHGDWSTNAAMRLARALRRSPRQIAEELSKALRSALPADIIESIDIAGAGFVNFRIASRHLQRLLGEIHDARATYGRTEAGRGKKALVEFVSANPTGPLTVGHGRNSVLGDTIAEMLAWTGHAVEREYYFNDAGRQMRVLAQSVCAWYNAHNNPETQWKEVGVGEGEPVRVPLEFPEDGYLGEYVAEIAAGMDGGLSSTELRPFKEAAEKAIFADIQATLLRLGIKMDSFFNEASLYESGAIDEVVARLREKDLAYDEEGAVWFRTTRFGKEADTVLVKSTGEPTYRLPDIAYHLNKLDRGYDRIIDIFGADHIATYPDILSALSALGYDSERVEVVIYQFVTLVREGVPVKMSTRKATYVTLDELLDEVGVDVTRFFFLMRSSNAHLEFDLDLAKKASDTNPVFYLQYAHARICSIVRKVEEEGIALTEEPDLTLLGDDAELSLIRSLVSFPEVVEDAATTLEPHRICNYLREVAVAFTQFYGASRIIGTDAPLAAARLRLAQSTGTVLRNGLGILGISAPERM